MAEEVALILVRVRTCDDSIYRRTLLISLDYLAAVMSCSNHVCSHLESTFQECIELDFPVAKHIRVGCTALFIFIKHIIHYPLAILLTKVDEVERDTDLAGYKFCHETVLFPLAVSVQGGRCIVPVLHEESKYIITLLLQEQGCNA